MRNCREQAESIRKKLRTTTADLEPDDDWRPHRQCYSASNCPFEAALDAMLTPDPDARRQIKLLNATAFGRAGYRVPAAAAAAAAAEAPAAVAAAAAGFLCQPCGGGTSWEHTCAHGTVMGHWHGPTPDGPDPSVSAGSWEAPKAVDALEENMRLDASSSAEDARRAANQTCRDRLRIIAQAEKVWIAAEKLMGTRFMNRFKQLAAVVKTERTQRIQMGDDLPRNWFSVVVQRVYRELGWRVVLSESHPTVHWERVGDSMAPPLWDMMSDREWKQHTQAVMARQVNLVDQRIAFLRARAEARAVLPEEDQRHVAP